MANPTLTSDQNKLVAQMAPLVKRIAYHFMARLPASVQVDDLIQAGLLGLMDAAKNFDDTQGAAAYFVGSTLESNAIASTWSGGIKKDG